MAKQKLMYGHCYFVFDLDEEDDEVTLLQYVEDDTKFKEIEIPDFVTDFTRPFDLIRQSLKVIYKGLSVFLLWTVYFMVIVEIN